MGIWREVEEIIYQRFITEWASATPVKFANEDKFDPPNGPWAELQCVRLPGGAGTLGRPGNKRMDRVGLLLIRLRTPPGGGVGAIDDLAEAAATIFENQRLSPHDIRFDQVEPGEPGPVEEGRWWGVAVEGRFEYEDLR